MIYYTWQEWCKWLRSSDTKLFYKWQWLYNFCPRVFEKQEINLCCKRWSIQVTVNLFWDTWKRKYLPALNVSRKWAPRNRNFKVGRLVVVPTKDLFWTYWPMGCIIEVYRWGRVVRSRPSALDCHICWMVLIGDISATEDWEELTCFPFLCGRICYARNITIFKNLCLLKVINEDNRMLFCGFVLLYFMLLWYKTSAVLINKVFPNSAAKT